MLGVWVHMPLHGEGFGPGPVLSHGHGPVLPHVPALPHIPRTLRVVECILWEAVEFGGAVRSARTSYFGTLVPRTVRAGLDKVGPRIVVGGRGRILSGREEG